MKQAGIMRDFLKAREAASLPSYASVEASVDDPPDFVAHGSRGERIAVELTELVSEEAIRRNLKAKHPHEHVYRDWLPQDVITAIEARLREKDGKTYKGGPYDALVVVIHTDEPTVTAQPYVPTLTSRVFPMQVQLTEAYVLFSYDPTAGGYPLVKLSFF